MALTFQTATERMGGGAVRVSALAFGEEVKGHAMRCMALWKQARISPEHQLAVSDPLGRAKVEGRRLESK
jgi:hypothetical protein